MIAYLIKSVLCSGLFIAAYYLLLEKETIHRFKRWYLLATLVLSCTIPLITLELEQPQLTAHFSRVEQVNAEAPLPAEQPVSTELNNADLRIDWFTWILVGYGIVTTALLFRMLKNFLAILSNVNNKTVSPYREATLVLDPSHVIPFSFLNYIFVSHQDVENKQIMLHEMTHVRQRHSLDILVVEFIHCLMWFNPAMIFYKRSIRLNHEFLADEVVLKNYPTENYQNILFQKAKLNSLSSLASSFNYSATKKRFIMMTTLKNKTRAMVKTAGCFVTLCCAVIVFSEKVYAQEADTTTDKSPLPDPTVFQSDTVEFDTTIEELKRTGTNKNGKPYVYYNLTSLTEEKKKRLIELYENFSEKQKKANYRSTYAIFLYPRPAPQKKSPTAEEMTAYADTKIYGVWLDGKRIPNSELAKYKPSDIALVWTSRLLKNAAHYGQYKFHTYIMTHAYYEKTYPAKSN